MNITSIRIYGQVPVEKNCSACREELQCQCADEADNVVCYFDALCNVELDVEPCIASWTHHISRKISNLLIRIL